MIFILFILVAFSKAALAQSLKGQNQVFNFSGSYPDNYVFNIEGDNITHSEQVERPRVLQTQSVPSNYCMYLNSTAQKCFMGNVFGGQTLTFTVTEDDSNGLMIFSSSQYIIITYTFTGQTLLIYIPSSTSTKVNTMTAVCSLGWGISTSPYSIYGCNFGQGQLQQVSITTTNTCNFQYSFGQVSSAYCPNNGQTYSCYNNTYSNTMRCSYSSMGVKNEFDAYYFPYLGYQSLTMNYAPSSVWQQAVEADVYLCSNTTSVLCRYLFTWSSQFQIQSSTVGQFNVSTKFQDSVTTYVPAYGIKTGIFGGLIAFSSNNTAFTLDSNSRIAQTCKIDTTQKQNALVIYCGYNPNTDMTFMQYSCTQNYNSTFGNAQVICYQNGYQTCYGTGPSQCQYSTLYGSSLNGAVSQLKFVSVMLFAFIATSFMI